MLRIIFRTEKPPLFSRPRRKHDRSLRPRTGGEYPRILQHRRNPQRIVRGPWREPFFIAWSGAMITLIALVAGLDGGSNSPYMLLLILPFLFAALSYTGMSIVLVGLLWSTRPVQLPGDEEPKDRGDFPRVGRRHVAMARLTSSVSSASRRSSISASALPVR